MVPRKTCLLFSLIIAFYTLSTLPLFSKVVAQDVYTNAGDYTEKGKDYFNKGFYDALPKKKKEEASQYFEQAVIAFKKAIALDKDCIQAHRNLARVYAVQKKYSESAEEYQKVTDVMPSDIDAYVLTALVYTKDQKYDQAMERLNTARKFTTDKAVIRKLEDYLTRIEQEKRSADEK